MEKAVCPFIDQCDPRCAIHLSLRRLEEALSLCADEYQTCLIHRDKQLDHEQPCLRHAEPALVAG
jgi:hypothetical protein